jgi:DNA polymerase type B, organellar and viral
MYDKSTLTYEQREQARKSNNATDWPSRKNRKVYDKRYQDNTIYRHYRDSEFIAVDGEGINSCGSETPCGEKVTVNFRIQYQNHKPGCQRYALLMSSADEGISNLEGLSTKDCLDYLLDLKTENPQSIFVIYGGSYDANMILKDLSYEDILILQKKKKVYWKNYRIAYIPRKCFVVSELQRWRNREGKRETIRSVTLWDVIGFFQASFITSLEQYFKEKWQQDLLHLDEIKEGKKRRSQFSQEELENFIKPYTKNEVLGLVNLMDQLRDNMIEAGIHLRRWDGAGAVAAELLRKYGVKKYYADLPPPIEHAAQIAYGGGRIEIMQYGHTEDQIFHYDLVGAYPSVMPLLPCLAGGRWSHVTKESGGHLLPLTPNTLYKVYWDYEYRYATDGTRLALDTKNMLFPFFYRDPWGDPRVFYPHSGYSWVWTPELEIALKHQDKLRGRITFYEKYEFIPSTDYRPFAFVSDLYTKRLEYKRKGMGAQLALKLGINSFYGKTAQTAGYQHKDGQRRPPFYNLAYAGLITSWTRSRMFDAAMQNPESVIAVATDGIWATEPLHPPFCPDSPIVIGENLGDWEFEILESMTAIQAGVYFARNEKGESIHHYRGFNEGSITEEQVLDAWRKNEQWMVIPTNRFTTMGTAVSCDERFENCWRVWDTKPRQLTIVPGGKSKRIDIHEWNEVHNAADSLIPLHAAYSMKFQSDVRANNSRLTEAYLSSPHPLPWDVNGYEMTMEGERQEREFEIDREIIESEL